MRYNEGKLLEWTTKLFLQLWRFLAPYFRACNYTKLNALRIYANGLHGLKPKSNIILTASMKKIRGADLHKSSLAVHDFSGSYLISSSNKGGYGIRNTSVSINRDLRIRRFDKNRRGWFKPLNLSINGKWIIWSPCRQNCFCGCRNSQTITDNTGIQQFFLRCVNNG